MNLFTCPIEEDEHLSTPFQHTHNMCQFLQSQVWQENTRATISDLASASADVADKMERSAEKQDQLLDSQERAIEYQRQMAHNGTMLSKAIEQSRANVREIMEEVSGWHNNQI